jgi:transposase InsO family protein
VSEFRTSFTAVAGHGAHLAAGGGTRVDGAVGGRGVLGEGRSKSEVARDYGVSRRWVQVLVQRFLAEGEAGLAPRSRRPHRSPQRTPRAIEDQIVAVRKELDELGHDNGAQTIAFHLEQRVGQTPSVSTIWRVLGRRGFVTPPPHKRPKSSYIRFEADQPNERWQLDITHWALADGTEVEILNQIDDHSRLAVSSDTPATFKPADVLTCFRSAAATWAIPALMLSDNGAVFTGIPRQGGRVALELELICLGVRFGHSRPYHPQTCGKIERFHQTQKRWLAKQPPAKTLPALQAQLDRVRDYHNTTRPHRALGRRTPPDAYQTRPKATPRGIAITDGHYRVRQDRVCDSGTITLRYDSRLHHIGLGRPHAGQRVLVLTHDRHIRVLTEDGQLLRDLTLDPTHNYQPQPKT